MLTILDFIPKPSQRWLISVTSVLKLFNHSLNTYLLTAYCMSNTVQCKASDSKIPLIKRSHPDELITFTQSYLSSQCYPITNLPWTAVILTTSQSRKCKSFLTLLFSVKWWVSQNHRPDGSLRNHLRQLFKLGNAKVARAPSISS